MPRRAALETPFSLSLDIHDLTKHDRFYSRNSFIEFLILDEVSTPWLMTQEAAVTRTLKTTAPPSWPLAG
jgi:hypothetical protein